MCSDNEIKEKVRDYWGDYIKETTNHLTRTFLQKAREDGFDTESRGITGINLPDFKNIKLKNDTQTEILGDTALDYEVFFNSIKSFDTYELLSNNGILRDGGVYPLLMEARKRAIQQHKRFRRDRIGLLTELKKHEKSLPKHAPNENRAFYLEAISKIEYLHKFSEALIHYLENEWLESFGLAKNMDKNPAKHPCWDPILINAYDVLTKTTSRPFTHTAACKYISELLGSIYPKIWCGNKDNIASNIRARLDDINPRLIKK